jgi:hypothetical protein
MRIVRLLISAFLIFLIIIGGGFFVIREGLLYLGARQIKSALRELTLARNRGLYGSQCVQLGASAVGSETPVTYQIRFVSSSDYVVEALCAGLPYEPILISKAYFASICH